MKLRYAIGGIAAAALLALPAGAAASQGGQVTSLTAQQCAQEKAGMQTSGTAEAASQIRFVCVDLVNL